MSQEAAQESPQDASPEPDQESAPGSSPGPNPGSSPEPSHDPAQESAQESAQEPAQGTAPPKPRSAARKSAADMLRTMAVILAAVALLVFLVPRPSSVPRADVDVASAAQAAERKLGMPVLSPVPAGWTVTSAYVREDTGNLPSWTINYLTTTGRYAALVQAAGWSERWQSSLTHGGTEQTPVTSGGRTWTHYLKSERDLTSLLVRTGRGRDEKSLLILAKGGGLPEAEVLATAIAGQGEAGDGPGTGS